MGLYSNTEITIQVCVMPYIHLKKYEHEKPCVGMFNAENSTVVVCMLEVLTKTASGAGSFYSVGVGGVGSQASRLKDKGR